MRHVVASLLLAVSLVIGLSQLKPEEHLLSNLLLAGSTPTVYTTNWITNAWAFTGGTDLSDAGSSANIAFIYTNDSGAVYFTNFLKSTTSREFARTNATGQSWVTWGVPSTGTVISCALTGLSWKLAANTKLSSLTNKVRIIDSSGVSVLSADLLNSNWPTVSGTGWSNILVGLTQTVVSGKQAASTDVRLELENGQTTGSGSGGANVQWGINQLGIRIQFYGTAP